jgi:hypothetical protein
LANLIGLCFVAFFLQIDLLYDTILPENMMTSFDSHVKPKMFQQVDQISKGDISIAHTSEYLKD